MHLKDYVGVILRVSKSFFFFFIKRDEAKQVRQDTTRRQVGMTGQNRQTAEMVRIEFKLKVTQTQKSSF